ncbi:MAG: plastocyanin/azurin family copper-binding protein [Actinomycetota bacterium]
MGRTCGRSLAGLAVTALLAAGCGGGDGGASAGPTTPPGPVDQTIEVSMVDIAFKPEALTVAAGSTVRFVFTNDGRVPHEAAFGDDAVQKELAARRGRRVGPAVGPNQTREHVYTFGGPGRLVIGCHVPGHWSAGMKIEVTVA